jgi:hypothetical protein
MARHAVGIEVQAILVVAGVTLDDLQLECALQQLDVALAPGLAFTELGDERGRGGCQRYISR